ncbi:Zinc finger protein CONSTANS-LIKE 7 [Cocos nucifera]|uniref:Zinc finger protein CONSTANS-LIKE 7 n=1 Tax=Cocos nucifera TaxID=13894 RepID=A0A8K0IIP2_COCNU|nr:Zinc finger protein CONSTANS-LIKE 7 [Cocos nucifera]
MSSTAYRRARTKIRRPKFLSLRRHLVPPPPEMASSATDPAADDRVPECQQLDLFPLHPQHLLLQDRDPPVSCLLDDNDGGGGAATLTALLGGAASTGDGSSPAASPVSSSVWDGDGDGLARRVLRGRERWVYCCSSAASSSEEEVASSGAGVDLWCGAPQALLLKLDYEEVLTAWSDRGSLYIDGDGPQVVPDLHRTASPVFVEVGSTGLRVPEGDRTEGKEVGNREARVMRYKEKRRIRHFSKRIRYEVRKLNAEKRPRMKSMLHAINAF